MNEANNQGQNTNNYSRFLPIANIGRIMKKALPQNAKIAKDAKQTVQQCVSQFISFITSQACQKCKAQKRKTINGQDLLASVDILGFDSYNGLLKLYLKKYRQVVKQSQRGQQLQKEEQQEGNDIDQSEEK